MTDAVDNAGVVIVCVSQGYKDSPMCRTEASYCFKVQTPIIPLMMEPDYIPDGWLGVLLGTTYNFTFYSDDFLETIVPKIEEKLQELGLLAHNSHADISLSQLKE
ncbi:uncharacterized protein LOC144444496 [Glandiceps talaboti]